VTVALDCIGTDEAIEVSLSLVADRGRILTIAASDAKAAELGILKIAGAMPDSAAYRDSVRTHLVGLAADGRLEVPMAGTYPLSRALDAAEVLLGQHPGGKLALIPD
jgi:NADPH:quinone reductase-like Zn-dependent oxidoreductase